TTFQLLRRTGTGEGMACIDFGCGGGDVTRGLARLVGPTGRVAGVDMDAVKVATARDEAAGQQLVNVEFRQASVYEWQEEGMYDRAYARFLLTHLPDPVTALANMQRALRP